jgi:hypothetical protein
MLAQQRWAVIVSASSSKEAIDKASIHLMVYSEVSPLYTKAFHPRKLPT